MRRRLLLPLPALPSLFAGLLFIASAPSAAGPRPLVLVLDASGSMWGQVAGEAKVVAARKVVAELGARLPEDSSLALVAYGHRREGDCEDIETLLPFATLDRERLRATIDGLNPKGKTPITMALQRAFAIAPDGATVVLVTDGLETCGGDPCAAVRAAKAKQSELTVHVVGFDVAKEDVSSLECAAQAGDGLYLPAANAAELARALDATAAPATPSPDGALVVRATRNGALQDVSIQVKPLSGGIDLGARTYASPETNPRTVPLADGKYRVRVHAVGIDGATERTFEVEIVNGGTVTKELDYSTGIVRIGATRNGALSDVTYQLFAPGDRKRAVDTGRTYRQASSNPAKVTIPSGDYDLVLTAIEIGGKPSLDLGRIVVPANGEVAIAHDFASGELALKIARGAALVDATVAVRGGGQEVDRGRSYASPKSNPIRFTLPPGNYDVEIAEIRGAKRKLTVEVAAGAVVEREVDLDKAE